MDDRLLANFMSGTTCCRDHLKEVLWEDDTYALLRHRGHSSYLNRFDGNAWCGNYVVLLRKASLRKAWSRYYGDAAVGYWEGRWTKARLAEAMNLVQTRA
jgi:hypothetical protein